MKPEQLRARRKAQEELDRTVNRAHRSAIEAAIHGSGRDVVVPEIIPTAENQVDARRFARRLARQADRTPRGPRRTKLIDDLLGALAHVVFVDRVMGLDKLERAALTPRRLMDMSEVSPAEVQAKLADLAGGQEGS